jgi:SAM-dependent methyltransferase
MNTKDRLLNVELADEKTYWETASETAWGKYLTARELRVLMGGLDLAPLSGGAMEVGCEGGRWSRIVAQRRGAVICTDVDPDVLEMCARRTPGARCILVDPDDDRLPAGEDELGFLLAYEVSQVTNSGWFITEAARVLQSGGVLVISHHNSASLRAVAYHVIARVERRRRKWPFYTGPSYAALRRSLIGEGFEVLHDEGMAWMPFSRESNSRLIPAATRLEAMLGLRRLPSLSPWTLTIARRV